MADLVANLGYSTDWWLFNISNLIVEISWGFVILSNNIIDGQTDGHTICNPALCQTNKFKLD